MIKVLCLSLILAIPTWVQAMAMDRIIAVVDDEVVLESELINMAQTLSLQLQKRQVAIPPRDVFLSQVLERLIMKRLQMQAAARRGIRLGDDDLNTSIRRIAQNNDMSLTEFKAVLERDGYNYASFRESVREDMIINRLKKVQIGDTIIISEREIDNFLATQARQGDEQDQYRLAHILISQSESATAEEKQAIQEKLARVQLLLEEGANFSEIASTYSDAQNALEGGELGWRSEGELPSLFAEVVPQMSVAQVSEVLTSPSGYHLVYLMDKKTSQTHMVKQTSASHILIKTNDVVDDDQAKTRLETLKKRVENGEDFAELARAHSDDMVSAIKGGDLGWTSSGVMVPEFEQRMNELEAGEMSEVFKSRFGWHLILLHQRREQNMAEEYRRSQAREQLHQRKMAEEIEIWLRQLRDEAYVEYRNL